MEPNIPRKKLFRMALYTSTVIGVIVVEPLYITMLTMVPAVFKMAPFNHVFPLFLISVLGGTIIAFIIWLFNIQLTYLLNKYSTIKISGTIKYVISYVVCFTFFISLRLILQSVIKFRVNSELAARANYFSFDVVRILILGSINTIILIIQDLVLLREKKAMIELENAQLKLKNVEAANQQLKQQIHPHFLFNSLNTLKTLIKKQPGDAEDYLVKLSDFLRVAISMDNIHTIKLGDELKLCVNYLKMQKMRFGEALQFTIDIRDETRNSGFVPVFSLQPLIENAIKHNAFTHEAPLFIRIVEKEGMVVVFNNVRQKITSEESTGMGLSNLTERYRILSGDEVRIEESDQTFSVSIKILGDDYSNHRR
jgi:sensor histidine kinase YesM